MSREPIDPTRVAPDDATIRLDPGQADRMRGAQRSAAPTSVIAPPAAKKSFSGEWLKRPLPKWAWLVVAAVGVLIILLLPLLFYSQPGVTVVLRGAPPNSQLFIDDALRGIPGLEQAGDNLSGLVRAHGLKSNVSHSVRVNCGGRDATLYLENGSSINDISARDGETINLKVKCEPVSDEVEYTGKMRLIKVGAGAFWMGDNNGEDNEKPARLVTLNYDYYIDKYEVTNQQYKEFSLATGIAPPSEPHWDSTYSVNNPESPVVGVSWNDAKRYCEKIGKRLPTEAEWEKAASWDPKATDDAPKWKRRWPWGNVFDPSRVNFASQRPVPVTQLASGASAYGVFNLAGNAGEWVEDSYNAYPGSQARDSDFGGQKRVIRGGTFRSSGEGLLRTTLRFGEQPGLSQEQLAKRSWLIGFRCAVKRDDPELQKYLKKSSQ